MVLGFVLCEWSRCAVEEESSGGHMDKGGQGHEHHHHHGGDDSGGNEVKDQKEEEEEEERNKGNDDDDDDGHDPDLDHHHHHHPGDEDGDNDGKEHKEEEEEEEGDKEGSEDEYDLEEHHEHHHHHPGDEEGKEEEEKKEDDDDDHDHHEDNDHHEHHHDGHDDSHVHKHTHSGPLFHNAAIITPSAVCSRAGRKLLQDGGNVVDAGIAALLCLGVVHPHTSGIGGTFSAILYNHTTGSVKSIRAVPPKTNLKSFGLPAVLPGIQCLHAQYGRLEWARLFEEAISLARDGFQIDHILSSALLINKRGIGQSKLCALFCDEAGRVKPVGSNVTNQNLSEVLRGISLNESHFPEMLAMKLAGDLSPRERRDFVRDVRRVRGEINDPLIAAREEKYILLSGTRPFSGPVLSDALDGAAELIHSLHNRTDLNSSAPSTLSLLNFVSEIYNATRTEGIGGASESAAVNAASSQIGVMHSHGHVLVISASLNSPWGSGRYLPSSGVLLSDFVSNVRAGAPMLNFPLWVKMKNMDDDDDDDDDADGDEEEDDVQIIAVTGGTGPALLNAAQILINTLERGMSAQDSVEKLPFRFAHRNATSVAVCAASVSNGTDIFASPQAKPSPWTDGCSDDSTAMLFRLYAGHVGAYGTPALRTHTDGF
ncbi:glutathione hydrolase 6 isoform X2 [Engraulis encrasicolus]